jgi:energy-coupling factor transporter ATP-binding protein EcfA2
MVPPEFPPLMRTHAGFPWGVWLGHFSDDRYKYPALWPTNFGGFWVQYAQAQELDAAQWVEMAILDLMQALPWKGLKIEVLDFGIRKRFQALAQLQVHGLYRISSDEAQAREALGRLENLARHRHHQLLDDETPTLIAFNRQAPIPEPFVALLINLEHFPQESGNAHRLVKLLTDAREAGIFCVAYGTPNRIQSTESNAEQTARTLREFFSCHYPIFQIGGAAPDTIKIENPDLLESANSPLPLASELRLSLITGKPALAPALATLHEKAANSKGRGLEQDFLVVPVGRTADGKRSIDWRMGSLSKNYNAMILGMPGSGKSTLLNNLLVGIAEQYTADQVRLYLMDYKNGAEFGCFSNHPNVEQIFLDNEDTVAADKLLETFKQTIRDRAQIFSAHNTSPEGQQNYVRNIDEYNASHPEAPLPHLILVIDEFQCLLGDDNLINAMETSHLLTHVAKQGRSVGVHLLLATQSLSGLVNHSRLLSAITLRTAFKLNATTDAESILEAGNRAPLDLADFQFILNPESGKKTANIFGLGLNTPDVQTRLAKVRSLRPAHICLTPRIVNQPKQAESPEPPAAPAANTPAAPNVTATAEPEEPFAEWSEALSADIASFIAAAGLTDDETEPPSTPE